MIQEPNLDIQRVQKYSTQMIEVLELAQKLLVGKIFYECEEFSIHKSYGKIMFKNHSPKYKNAIFSSLQIEADDLKGYECKVTNLDYDYDYKLEYIHNRYRPQHVTTLVQDNANHYDLVYNEFYTKEQLLDEAFLFQQSLMLDSKALFGVCCASWLNLSPIQNIFIICELDVDDMDRIYNEVERCYRMQES